VFAVTQARLRNRRSVPAYNAGSSSRASLHVLLIQGRAKHQRSRAPVQRRYGLFRSRAANDGALAGRPIRIPRGFEWNFSSPQTPEERRIKELDDAYRAKKVTELEQEVFKQKKRLADAERKLRAKETKTALNEQRVATSKIQASLERIKLLTTTQSHEDDHRIFPLTYAPIILKRDNRNVVTLARYHLRQKGQRAFTDQKFPGLYNARRDNLERFWRSEFGHPCSHGRRVLLRERRA
jgi:hypothetical protein